MKFNDPKGIEKWSEVTMCNTYEHWTWTLRDNKSNPTIVGPLTHSMQ